MSKLTNISISRLPLALVLAVVCFARIQTAVSAEKNAADLTEAEATIRDLAYWPTRFDTWVDRCKLRALEQDKRTIDPAFLSAFRMEDAEGAKVQKVLEKFMEDADALGEELMFRGDPGGVRIPGRANKNPVEYLEVPRRDGPQILLKRKYALELADIVGDPATALAMVHLVSRDFNHHGRLAIAHPITALEKDDGSRVFVVRRILLSSAGRNPIGEGNSAGSAASLATLADPFGRFFAAEKLASATEQLKNAAFGGPVSDSIKLIEHPSMESLRGTGPVDQLDEAKLGPLTTKHPDLAKIIMEHTDLIIFTGTTELLTLFHIGVPEKPARQMSGILDESVTELTRRLAEKNKGVEIAINGPQTKVQGLTKAEHHAVVAELKDKLTERFPDFPADLTEYVSEAFSHSTRGYTNRWKIKVTEDRTSGLRILPGGGYPRHTDAEATDLEGNRTNATLLPYSLRFLKYIDPK